MLPKLLFAAAMAVAGIGANAAVITIQPYGAIGKDAAINNEFLSDVNYGSQPYMTQYAASDNFGLIEFNLSPYLGQQIQSASLHLFAEFNTGLGGQVYSISENLSSWNESTVTYNNAPLAGPVLDTFTTVVGQQWYSFDVTTAVADWLTGEANYGLRITETNGFLYIASSDHQNALWRPYLEIETASVPEPGTITLLSAALLGIWGTRRRGFRRQS